MNSRKTLRLNAGDVATRIEFMLREAAPDPAPILHMNADALVMEFTDTNTGFKVFQRVSGLKKNNS